ncbi:MAG: nucleotide sugar dehydrogenase [Elusimicrobia bacterium]|nr:nucleotide sugar dehydrogenase [Elusimicrobiota bacterium]
MKKTKTETTNICIIGTGYVGLVSGACLAEMGHRVVCVDSDPKKIAMLEKGAMPIYEEGLERVVKSNVKAKRLFFTNSIKDGMQRGGRRAEAIFIAVGTPPREDGSADLSAIEKVAEEIARNLSGYTVIVEKSTVPVETCEWINKTVLRHNRNQIPFDVASNPEFLREGSAVRDFLKPDRVVLGCPSKQAEAVLRKIYKPMKGVVLVTDVKSAELIKHASNSFLSTKISFINAVANVCEKTGADIEAVAKGMGMDKRIGMSFLKAGIGFGGFCLHPDEPVLVRDPAGHIRLLPISLLYAQAPGSRGIWEALSLDLAANTIRFEPITAVSRRPYRGGLLRIKTRMGKETTVTEDHPLVISSPHGRWTTKPAAEVCASDWMPVFLTVPASPRHREVDIIESLKAAGPGLTRFVKLRPRRARPWALGPEARKQLLKLSGGDSSRVHDIAFRGGPMSLSEWLQLERRGLAEYARSELELGTAKGNATYAPAVVRLTDSFCRLLGYLAAQRCISVEAGERGERERIVFHFNESEREFLKDVEDELRRLDIRFTRFHAAHDHVRRIIVSSRVFAYFLRDVLGCGTDSYSARVPDAVFSSPCSARKAFFEGAWRGDGSVHYPAHSPAVTYEFATASGKMAAGMTSLAHSLGVVPSGKVAWQRKSTKPAHSLRISGARQIRALSGVKGARHEARILKRLERLKREPAPAGYRILSPQVGAVRIIGKELIPYNGWVYSLEVDVSETFATGSGLILHNCFPKDLEAFYWLSHCKGYDFELLKAVKAINESQKLWLVKKTEEELWNLEGKTVALLGLAFKPNTDDMRFAPSIDIIAELLKRGVKVRAYDPVSQDNAKKIVKGVYFAKNAYDCVTGADCVCLVTEWDEFAKLDLKKALALVKHPIMLDGRNLYSPAKMREMGWTYKSVGRQ